MFSINRTTYVVVAPNDPELVWISRWKFTLLGSQQLYLKATVYTNKIKEHINVYQCIYTYSYVYSHKYIYIYNTHIDMIRSFDQYIYIYP